MEPFLGEIRAFSWNRNVTGWLPCDGRILQVNQYQALYTLLSNMYGGSAPATFALPDLRGVGIIGEGLGYTQGKPMGSESVTPTVANLPAHSHTASFQGKAPTVTIAVANVPASLPSPDGNVLAQSTLPPSTPISSYATTPIGTATLGGVSATAGTITGGTVTIGQTGGNPLALMPPYQTVCYMIAYQGIYPTRQ